MYSGTHLDIKKQLQFFFMLYQHTTVSSSVIKFTRLTPKNVCAQAKGILKPTETLVLIQHHVERILLKKKLSYQIVSPYY